MTETIQLLLYKENRSLLEKIYFEDDNIFLEPFLFAYFNSKKEGLFSSKMVTEIMQGYFVEKEPLYFKESLNIEGIAYLPNLGYFDKTGNKVDELLLIDKLEILKICHPLLAKYFIEFYKGHIVNPKPTYNSVWKENYKDLEKAILIIKQYLQEFYQDLVLPTKEYIFTTILKY